MTANKTLLRMKYARVISLFAERAGIPAGQAMGFFYHSTEYHLMREGIGDLHCMTDDYIVDDLMLEWKGQGRYDAPTAKLAESSIPWSIRIEDTWHRWEQECENRFQQLKANEEELNRIFIDIYGLQDELTPEVADKDVTVRKADLGRDIRSLVSYAVGCMFGRYSLDVEGLAFAGGEWDPGKYRTYIPDPDNCIPITDEEYFSDDIVGRFVEFVRVVYGEDTLEENLDFVAKALGNKGNTSREVIRNYFLNDFYKDHLKVSWRRKNDYRCRK